MMFVVSRLHQYLISLSWLSFDKLFSVFLSTMVIAIAAGHVSAQTVAINEVMASNATTIADEDGDFEDWIELYNYGTDPVALSGFGLSDDYERPFRWVFPDVSIEPGEYLLVWASGKDRRPAHGQKSGGILREVYTGISGSSVSDLVNHHSYPDHPTSREVVRDLFEAPTNVGDHYGQRMHGWIKPPLTGMYTFWIASDDNGELHLSLNDDPANASMVASVPGWTTSREWSKYSQQSSGAIYLVQGRYYYIKALMKEHEGGDNLAVGWQLPDGTMERPIRGEHLFTYEGQLHANFRIKSSGEEVTLTDPEGNPVCELEPTAIPTDVSYGRIPDGSGDWYYFGEPTPGAANHDEGFSDLLAPPQLSHQGGFYDGAFYLSLTHDQEDVQIVYTLDGSVPDPENLDGRSYRYKNQYPQNAGQPFGEFLTHTFRSHVYTDPIQIYDRSDEPDKLSQISSTYHRNPNYFPSTPVHKGMVVRARAVRPGALSSPVSTATYFVNHGGVNPNTLPTISITVQEDELFDYEHGIYVAGKVFDDWRAANPNTNASGGTTANYWLGGIHTEKPAHLEYFDIGDTLAVLRNDIGLRLHGGWSRAHPMKSFRLYARNVYGESTFNHPFFPELADSSFKRLILRNSGNDFYNTLYRDAAIQRMISHMRFDTQAYQPAIVYVNGEYWGIHNIRERYDKHYLARVYGIDPDNIDLLENNALVYEGDAEHYNQMLAFLQTRSPALPSNYDYVKTQMDVGSFIDYQIANIFMANTDWPGNNMKFWRYRTDQYEPDAPHGHDGRWRWLCYDTDFGLGLYGPVTHNTMQFATAASGPGWPNPPWSTYLLRRLLINETFRNDFINRFADMLNTAFQSARMAAIIREMKQVLDEEMPRQLHRWNSPGWGSINAWNNQVNDMISFVNQRPAYQRSHIRNHFGISAIAYLTADVSNTAAGYIRVNTIDLKRCTPGVANNPYPWSGAYFDGIPIEVEAIPRKGYTFSHWSGEVRGHHPVVTLTPRGSMTLKAHFASSVSDTTLVHYWHFDDLGLDKLSEVESDFSRSGLAAIRYVGEGDGFMDSRTYREQDPVSNLNLHMDRQPDQGAVLRVRNPSKGRALIMEVPSNGYEELKVSFATTRTTNGPTHQTAYYSVNGGADWVLLEDSYDVPLLPDWALKTFDLSGVASANDNAYLQLKIGFAGESITGPDGNNRFDNISVSGTPMLHTGNHDPGHALTATIMPNPVRDHLTFNLEGALPQEGILRVIHPGGRIVKEIPIYEKSTLVSVGDLAPGVYLISFSSRNVVIHERFIKY